MSTSAYSSYLKSQKVDFLADRDNGDGWTVSLSATLREEKLAVSHLSPRDLLRGDYKEYSFTAPASDDATQSSNDIEDWLAERDLSVLSVLTTFRNKNDKGRREQLWVIKAPDEAVAAKLWPGLKSSEELGLERFAFSKFIGNTGDTAEESEDDDAEEVTTDEAFGESCIARAYKQGVKTASNTLSTLLGHYTHRYIHKYARFSYTLHHAAALATVRQKAVQGERSTSMLASEILNFGTSHHAAALAEVRQTAV
ncbi:hypothetical protein DFH29DRAFT_882526 [Suillus ampliporus]|nr:hypothetical protein DFH29DRAFT_882526 [Suillus ampliporus]